jgi:hypothetical protein
MMRRIRTAMAATGKSRGAARPPRRSWLATLFGLLLPLTATAQDYDAMIRQQMAAMNANIARGQQQVQQMVQQRMRDPAVQQAWMRYLQSTGGRPAMDYPSFTYQYIYTNGFSAQGVAAARANESHNQAAEQAAWQGLQQAEQRRRQAQQGLRDGAFANQQEAGRQLQGMSTYRAADGSAQVLPHTWQPGQTVRYEGNTYHVDAGGRYFVLGGDGLWYPMAQR